MDERRDGKILELVVSYLKEVLMLLSNCGKVPTDVISILWDIFFLVECDNFTSCTPSVYFGHKQRKNNIAYSEYLILG